MQAAIKALQETGMAESVREEESRESRGRRIGRLHAGICAIAWMSRQCESGVTPLSDRTQWMCT
jgi:hypothetical protein